MASTAAAVLYEEALRRVVAHEAALRDVRNRSAAVLSASLVVAGLYGSRWVDQAREGWQIAAAVAALVALGVLAALTGRAQAPKSFGVGVNMGGVLAAVEAEPDDYSAEDVQLNFASALWALKTANVATLESLNRELRWSCWLLPVLVVLGGVAVA